MPTVKNTKNISSQKFEPITFYLDDNGDRLQVKALPHDEPTENDTPLLFEIIIGNLPQGSVKFESGEWKSSDIQETTLVESIGENISKYYPQKVE